MFEHEEATPLYMQIEQAVLAKIDAGEWQLGDKLPSEVQIAKIFNVNRLTARHAMVRLMKAGIVSRKPGQGTFVARVSEKAPDKSPQHGDRPQVIVITPGAGLDFVGDVTESVIRALDRNGYNVVIWSYGSVRFEERDLLLRLRENTFAGLIHIAAPCTIANKEYLAAIIQRMPTVLVDADLGLPVDVVKSADLQGATDVTTALIELGHRRILHLTGQDGSLTSLERAAGYRAALEQHGISYDPQLVRQAAAGAPGGYCEVKKAYGGLTYDEIPTAIFAYNDAIAMGAYKGLHELNLRIPQDVAVVGYGNLEIAEFCSPPLTTVDQSPDEIGLHAANLLLDKICGRRAMDEHTTILIPPRIITRESCGIREVSGVGNR